MKRAARDSDIPAGPDQRPTNYQKDVASCSLLQHAIARQRLILRPASVSPVQLFCGIVAPRYRDIRKGVGLRVTGHAVVFRTVFFNVSDGPLMMTSTLTEVPTNGRTNTDAPHPAQIRHDRAVRREFVQAWTGDGEATELDPDDRLKLFHNNRRLARWFVLRMSSEWNRDDAQQVADMALWKAAQALDPSKGFKFSTFVGACIKYAVLKELKRQRRQRKGFQFVEAEGDCFGEANIPDNLPDVREASEALDVVRCELTKLPEKNLAAVAGVMDGHTRPMIGQQTGVCTQSVANSLNRGTEMLQETVPQQFDGTFRRRDEAGQRLTPMGVNLPERKRQCRELTKQAADDSARLAQESAERPSDAEWIRGTRTVLQAHEQSDCGAATSAAIRTSREHCRTSRCVTANGRQTN
jgi:RNA polymerase sigma factor (sigma-70 family)